MEIQYSRLTKVNMQNKMLENSKVRNHEVPRLYILFGSQTGTAEDVAERVGREFRRRHFPTYVIPLDEYKIENLIYERYVLFVVSTTGQGDPPDNMKKFWRFILRKNLPENSLSNLLVSIAGLGDSSYLKFNFIAKKLHKRLFQLGAESLTEVAYADEQHPLGLDAEIDPWISRVLEEMLQLHPLPPDSKVIPKNILLPPKFTVNQLPASANQENEIHITANDVYNNNNPWLSTITYNQRKTHASHFQDVRLINFSFKGSELSYSPGDVLMVMPQNIKEKVDEFFSIIGWNKNLVISVQQRTKDIPIPVNVPRTCSLENLFTTYFSIQGVPKRYFFELLLHFTSSELEKERLNEFLNTRDGQEDLFDYCYRPKRSYIEVLQDFPHARQNLKLEYVFDLFPPMMPRAFSIASSIKVHPESAEILMAVVKYKTKMYTPRCGVCSTWLASLDLTPMQHVKVWISRGTINFPKDDSIPVIMVGPGTGVAPFRSFIEERATTNATGEMMLFFGCRNREGDDFFYDEWNELMSRAPLSVHTAYSRDQPSKIYVQDKMKEQGEKIWKLLEEKNAFFFIAGNAKDMPHDVISCLKNIISEYGNMDCDNADAYFKSLETKRRFQCETWS